MVSADKWAVAAPFWGLDAPPNLEGHAWNLRVSQPLPTARGARGFAQGTGANAGRSGLRVPRHDLFAGHHRARPAAETVDVNRWRSRALKVCFLRTRVGFRVR